MNGHELKEMPVNGTPISDDLSREDGINIQHEAAADMTSTKPVTVYYLAESDEQTYYVPVTKERQKTRMIRLQQPLMSSSLDRAKKPFAHRL